MSPEFAEAGRIDVKINSAKNTSRKKICEILRNSGNLECATNFPYAPVGDCANAHPSKLAVAPGRRTSYIGIIHLQGFRGQ